MARYSDEIIEEVRQSNDIVDIISQYVRLKRSGRNYFGLCPFHNEKSPSFSVSPDKQIFHCFGCGVGGNVFTFLMKIEGINFIEAVQMLAEKSQIQLPTFTNSGDAAKEELKNKVYQVNEFAAQYYHQKLYLPESKIAQEYVKKRKLSNETLKSFRIGFSGKFDELYRELVKQGFAEREILESGLVNKNEQGKFIDRYRNRLMFPICDARGKVIAFGGRVLDDSKPKYINSPENIVYSKGRHLFGLNVAKKGDMKKLLIVEGYMDVIQMSQGGFLETVAALGTSITPEHVKKLFQLSDHVYFSFDGDAAGFKAARRAMESTLSIITDTQTAHFVLLPQDEDPDSLIKSQGPEAFEAQLRSAFPLSKFFVMDIVREVSQGQGLRTAEERAQAVAIAKPLLQRMTAHALRQLLVQEFAAAVRMEPAEVASLCGVTLLDVPQTKPAKALSGYGRDTKQGERSKRPVRPVTTGPVFTNIKRRLLQCFVTHPSWLIKYSDQIEYEMLDTVDEWEEAIVRLWHLAQDHSKGEGFEESKLTTGYLLSFMQGDPLYNRLADLASEEEVLQTPEAVAEFEIKCAFLKLEKAQLDAQIAELLSMEERGEPVESQYLERLFKRRQDIHRSLIDESSQAVDFVLDSRLSG